MSAAFQTNFVGLTVK